MVFLILRDPASWHPATWSENATTPIAGALSLWVVGAWVWLLRRRSKLHPAERVLRDFYATLDDDGKIRQLEDFVTSQDFDDSQRRETPFGLKATVPRITNPPELDFYWNTLIRGNDRPRTGVEVVGIRLQEISDDLRLAYIRLRLSRRPTWLATLSYLVLIPVAVLVGTEISINPWAQGAVAGCAVIVWMVLDRMIKRSLGEYRVRKLLVRSGRQWRLFCGEWEGHEEADLSWLDHPSEQDSS
jgi:hypothetical protein